MTGRRRDYWLGARTPPKSLEAYHRVIAEWISLGRRLPSVEGASAAPRIHDEDAPTVADVIERFWQWAAAHHSRREQTNYKTALRLLRWMDGSTPACGYGPRRLRLLREAMISGDPAASPPREPWSRPYVNAQVKRVRRVFKWAVSHEIVSPEVYQALATVDSLRRGKTAAREPERVLPPDESLIDAALPHMSRQVRALVELQMLTGARPAEVVSMRAVDIDTESAKGVWIYRPREHKTSYRGDARAIYLGPRAQEIVRPFLAGRRIDAPLFSPAEADAERRAALRERRKTPLSCGNRPGTNRRESPAKQPGDAYTPETYYRAVQYACDAAFPPEPLTRDEAAALLRACEGNAPAAVRNRALVCALHRAGLRVREALALEPKDVDLATCAIRVLRGKGGRSRTVGIDRFGADAIGKWMRARRDLGAPVTGPIFLSIRGNAVGPRMTAAYARVLVARLGRRAGIAKRVHPHGLRHTLAVELREEGIDIAIISKQLGHRSISTTARYLDHLAPLAVVEAMRRRA